MKTQTLKLGGCLDCPFRQFEDDSFQGWCGLIDFLQFNEDVTKNHIEIEEEEEYDDSFPEKCPLKDMDITISRENE